MFPCWAPWRVGNTEDELLFVSSCPQREIKLSTDLQAVAVSVSLDKEITICSVYIPPNYALQSKQLDS